MIVNKILKIHLKKSHESNLKGEQKKLNWTCEVKKVLIIFLSSLIPPSTFISCMKINFIACSFQCKMNLTRICSALGRNQWVLQVSLKCFCCCLFFFSSPSLYPIKFAFSCMHAQDRQLREWEKIAMRKFVFLLLLPKLFKCYLHEIYIAF